MLSMDIHFHPLVGVLQIPLLFISTVNNELHPELQRQYPPLILTTQGMRLGNQSFP